eukprot:sb/3470671/
MEGAFFARLVLIRNRPNQKILVPDWLITSYILGLRSSQPVQVTIYNVPKITHSLPPTTNVTAGKTDLLLQCGITRDFADYQWYRRGVPLMREYYKDNQAQVRIDIRKGVGLYFYSVLPEDQGEYTCNVSNPAATASVSGKLFVDVMPTISVISPSIEVRDRIFSLPGLMPKASTRMPFCFAKRHSRVRIRKRIFGIVTNR